MAAALCAARMWGGGRPDTVGPAVGPAAEGPKGGMPATQENAFDVCEKTNQEKFCACSNDTGTAAHKVTKKKVLRKSKKLKVREK